jgi:hypothetical protein
MTTQANPIQNVMPPDMLNTQLAARTSTDALSGWYTADQVAQRVQLVQQIYRSVMKPDVHYGTIPGCDKPSLWKPGSEQLLMTFRIAVTPEVEDLSTADCARYRVTLRFTHAPTGLYLGAGIGEASTDETKYKWRKARCVDEYEATDAGRRQIVWKSGQRGAYSEMQVRTNMADVANTALKIAKKRAQIDGTLTITAASDIFTQDLEDTPELFAADAPAADSGEADTEPQRQAPPAKPTVQMPTRKAPQPASAPVPITPRSYASAEPTRPTPLQASNARTQQRAAQPARLPQGEKVSEPQARRFFAKCMGAGITKPEMKNYLEQTWGISVPEDLVKGACYEQAIAWAEGN